MGRLKFFVFGALVVSLLYFVFPLPVSSQEYHSFRWEKEHIQSLAKWHVGPFRIYPLLYFRNVGYDGNVFRQREEDDPVSDVTATVSPIMNSYIIFKNWVILNFMVNPEYVFFAKTERERSFNFSYSGGAKFNLFHSLPIDWLDEKYFSRPPMTSPRI